MLILSSLFSILTVFHFGFPFCTLVDIEFLTEFPKDGGLNSSVCFYGFFFVCGEYKENFFGMILSVDLIIILYIIQP